MKSDASHDRGRDLPLVRYYQFHSRIYDATRWTFLFGRQAIVDPIIKADSDPRRILEVGCGTGRNLADLCRRFPHAQITGVDLSAEMLNRAHGKLKPYGARVQLLHQAYETPLILGDGAFDLILFAYALSMFNPGFESAIDAAHANLVPGGHIAAVDFHDTRYSWFERWMGVNHVRMNGQLLPIFRAKFEPKTDLVLSAYGSVWRYFMFVGSRNEEKAQLLRSAGAAALASS